VVPVPDPEYSGDLAGRLYGLVIIFSGRVPADQAQWLHHAVEAGEYGLALEDLAAMLAYGRIIITGRNAATSWPRPARWQWTSARPRPGLSALKSQP
jgi:hypothetical protein